jgi:hypothetical protein
VAGLKCTGSITMYPEAGACGVCTARRQGLCALQAVKGLRVLMAHVAIVPPIQTSWASRVFSSAANHHIEFFCSQSECSMPVTGVLLRNSYIGRSASVSVQA